MGSVKTSFGIGRRPCSKGSRLGRRRETGFGVGFEFGFGFGSLAVDEDDVEGSITMGSLMALSLGEREREKVVLQIFEK